MPLAPEQTIEKNGLLATLRLDAMRDHRCTGIGLISQMVGQLQTELADQGSAGGACLAMSAEWLKGRGDASEGLLKKILGPGGTVDKEVLSQIVTVHKNVTGGMEGAAKFAQVVPGLTFSTECRFQASLDNKPLGDALFETEAVRLGQLVMLGTEGGTFFHAMAMDMTRHVFFDPNFGEFAFGSKDDLKGFLNRVFPFGDDGHVRRWWYVRKRAYCTHARAWLYT